MKKLILVVWFSYAMSNAMEDSVPFPGKHEENVFENWQDLPEELKSHILSFVPTRDVYTQLKFLLSINKDFFGHITSQSLFPLFIDAYAQKQVKENVEKAKQLLLQALTNDNQKVAKSFAQALVKYNPAEANKLLGTYFHVIRVDETKALEARALVELFLNAGFDPNQLLIGPKPMYPLLQHAVMLNHVAIARLLLEHGADVNIKAISKATPLWTAVHVQFQLESKKIIYSAKVQTAMVSLLLEHNADPLLDSPSALAIAEQYNLQDVIALLKDAIKARK